MSVLISVNRGDDNYRSVDSADIYFKITIFFEYYEFYELKTVTSNIERLQ